MSTRTHPALGLLGVILAGAGCAVFSASQPKALADSRDWQTYGAALSGTAQEVTLADLVKDPAAYDGKPVLLADAKVEAVCKKKGCWMILDEAGTDVRVTFLDYGFFMPLDCEGRRVVLEGIFQVATIKEADAKHYLEDAGKPEEAAKLVGDQKELSIVATGVRMAP